MATKKPAAPAAPTKSAAKPKAAGTAVAVKKTGGAMVDIAAAMKAELASLSERTAPAGGDKIQLKGKVFTLPDGSKHDSLDVVIVDFMAVNNYYEGTYDPRSIVPPTCFAIGQIPTALVPSKNAPVRQSDSCGGCPMNQYESATTGSGKACKNQRRLALLPPDADPDTPLWVMDIPPTALKSFDSYIRSTSSKFGVLPVGLITTITFDDAVDYPSPRFGNPVPNENIEQHWARRSEAMERLSAEPDVSGYVEQSKPGARKAPARPAARR